MSVRCICSGILFADLACWPIDHLPEQGELVQTEKIQVSIGGHASNVSLNLEKLEVPVVLGGCIGDDALSDYILKVLKRPGIDISRLQRAGDSCPGTALHINVLGQDRRFICTTGANDLYTFNESLLELIESNRTDEPKVFYLGGFLMLKGLENEKTCEILSRARKNGWTVIFDMVIYGEQPYWDRIRPILPHVDIFMPNNDEAVLLCGDSNSEVQADFFLRHGAAAVVITQGSAGTLYKSDELEFHTPIFPMPEFLSGAGSGDAFAAGYIAAFLEGHDPKECVRWGSAQGASCVRGLNTTDTVFNRKELAEFLESHKRQ